MRKEKIIPVVIPGVAVGNSVLNSTDPLGSYTGRPSDPYEIPVQDADDL